MYPYRTRFKKDIVAEFFPPLSKRKPKEERVIILCPGQPGRADKTNVMLFWAKKGFWIFNMRYRGTWESDGVFLRSSPAQDVLDVLNELPKGFTEAFAHRRFHVGKEAKYYLFGNSFGGPAALLLSSDSRVEKVVASSPVVDWRDHIKHGETIDWGARFTAEAFGAAYRTEKGAWKKLKTGAFYNPAAHANEIDGQKVLIIHAQDDRVVRFGPVARFSKKIGATLIAPKRGGHGSSSWSMRPRFYKKIAAFLRSTPNKRRMLK